MHKMGNNGVNANFEFPYTCSFPLYLNQVQLGNVKLNISDQWVFELCVLTLESSLILFISNGRAKTNLASLSFLLSIVYENLESTRLKTVNNTCPCFGFRVPACRFRVPVVCNVSLFCVMHHVWGRGGRTKKKVVHYKKR